MVTKENQRFLLVYKVMNDIVFFIFNRFMFIGNSINFVTRKITLGLDMLCYVLLT
jgi:hypothetical protein